MIQILESKLEKYFMDKSNLYKFDLANTICEPRTINELFKNDATSLNELLNTKLDYAAFGGSIELRTEIAHIEHDVEPSNIIVTSSPTEAIFLTLNVIASMYDESEIIVQTPCFPALKQSLFLNRHYNVKTWDILNAGPEFYLDLNSLEEKINKNTRALVLNIPNNPTGFVPTTDELNNILYLAIKNDLWLVIDEIYQGLDFSKTSNVYGYEKLISITGLSKMYGLPGLQIGWVKSHSSSLIENIGKLKQSTTIVNTLVGEKIAYHVVKMRNRIFRENAEIFNNNFQRLQNILDKCKDILFTRHSETSFIFCKLVNISATSFCENALQKYNILMIPSTIFDYGNSHVRIGFGQKNAVEGLNQLETFILDLQKYE